MTDHLTDYLATLNEVHPRHCGLLFEQLNQAALKVTQYLRCYGYCLPNSEEVDPSYKVVYNHIYNLVNDTLDAYYAAQKQAPKHQLPNEICGYGGDDLFTISVTGLSESVSDGYTSEIDINLLYP